MSSVLAIDAAWTDTEPSGIALLDDSRGGWSCVALAPSYESFIERGQGSAIDWKAHKIKGCYPNLADLIQASQSLLGGHKPELITIDMPIATGPITGRRVADDQISSNFGGRGCSTHTPSTTRPGPLGADLMASLTTNGYQIATDRSGNPADNHAIEVYPHPALLTLLNEVYRVPYKISKSKKYWPGTPIKTRITNILGIFERIKASLDQEIKGIPLVLPTACQVGTMSVLKRYEDALDALICGWSGIKYLRGEATPYGDHTAAIWVP